MNLDDFHRLLSPSGQLALQAAEALAPREETYLPCFQQLSRRYPADLARPALEIAIQRHEAAAKFPSADKLYFSREALEQASAWEVARYRSKRYSPFYRVIDLGCSAGGDALALAGICPVTGIDRDPLRLAMARANAEALGLEANIHFIQADLRAPLPLKPHPGMALFFDPARRLGGKRLHSVRRYQPPLETINNWLADFPALGAKISPGVDLAELAAYPAEVEFISLRGELKEAALWFGPLHSAARRATLLPGAHSLAGDPAPPLPLRPPGAYLYEPDPAVLRAGLVANLGEHLGAAQLDADIAYLTADSPVETPFARMWRVEDWLPFSLKRLREVLRQRGVGRVTVKKRGSPLQPETLIRDLRLTGNEERVVFLTHLRGEPIAVIALP
jgi:SAM-dependent methyltransferase